MSYTTESPPSADKTRGMIRNRIDWVRMVPEGEFRKCDDRVPENLPLKALRRSGAIEVLRKETVVYQKRNGVEVDGKRNVYRLTEQARGILENGSERYSPCPCGHAGLENHGDHYECGFEPCEREFSRDELEVDDGSRA